MVPCTARRPASGGSALLGSLLLIVALLAGCSNDSDSSTGARGRPDGPVADLSERLDGSAAPFIGSSTGVAVPTGYVEEEFVASGTATSYRAVGDLGTDGRWIFEPDTSADYRTRVLIRRPTDPDDFSGTVVVEWLNVSGGLDANPEYSSVEEELIRRGHAWVGISAQLIGVQGGPVLVSAPGAAGLTGKGLVAIDPERYSSLVHPGDGYSFDIFTQVARAVRRGGDPLGGTTPERLIAAGESQSALALTTYYNGVQPLTAAFDGFFMHSRASVALPLVAPGQYADLASSMTSTRPTILRTDLPAPVLELQAESDVLGVLRSIDARQPDTDTFRLWEVAGTAHADAHLLGALSTQIDCGLPINDGPLHLVAKAALRALTTWVDSGTPPPEHPRLAITTASPAAIARDADGIAIGGIRTPQVEVPIAVLSGEPGANGSLLCILLGSTRPLPAPTFVERYGDSYQERFEAATQRAIEAGVLLEEDSDLASLVHDAEITGAR